MLPWGLNVMISPKKINAALDNEFNDIPPGNAAM